MCHPTTAGIIYSNGIGRILDKMTDHNFETAEKMNGLGLGFAYRKTVSEYHFLY